MKKILAAGILAASSTMAFAEAPGGPNCGWGNMVFNGQSGMVAHFGASTTNGTSGNATFGMTSGTNGCSTNGTITYGGKQMVSSLMGELTEDVARGEGDALSAVAAVLGVAPEDRSVFASAAHQNFARIFPSAEVTADEVIAALYAVMAEDARLAHYVG
ncbi:MAG: DUF3015 domain-containing protein [Oceanococcaceae bacterium]